MRWCQSHALCTVGALGPGSWPWKVRQWRRHLRTRTSEPGGALGRDGRWPFRLQWRPKVKKRGVAQFHTRLRQEEQDKVDLSPGENDFRGEDSDSSIAK